MSENQFNQKKTMMKRSALLMSALAATFLTADAMVGGDDVENKGSIAAQTDEKSGGKFKLALHKKLIEQFYSLPNNKRKSKTKILKEKIIKVLESEVGMNPDSAKKALDESPIKWENLQAKSEEIVTDILHIPTIKAAIKVKINVNKSTKPQVVIIGKTPRSAIPSEFRKVGGETLAEHEQEELKKVLDPENIEKIEQSVPTQAEHTPKKTVDNTEPKRFLHDIVTNSLNPGFLAKVGIKEGENTKELTYHDKHDNYQKLIETITSFPIVAQKDSENYFTPNSKELDKDYVLNYVWQMFSGVDIDKFLDDIKSAANINQFEMEGFKIAVNLHKNIKDKMPPFLLEITNKFNQVANLKYTPFEYVIFMDKLAELGKTNDKGEIELSNIEEIQNLLHNVDANIVLNDYKKLYDEGTKIPGEKIPEEKIVFLESGLKAAGLIDRNTQSANLTKNVTGDPVLLPTDAPSDDSGKTVVEEIVFDEEIIAIEKKLNKKPLTAEKKAELQELLKEANDIGNGIADAKELVKNSSAELKALAQENNKLEKETIANEEKRKSAQDQKIQEERDELVRQQKAEEFKLELERNRQAAEELAKEESKKKAEARKLEREEKREKERLAKEKELKLKKEQFVKKEMRNLDENKNLSNLKSKDDLNLKLKNANQIIKFITEKESIDDSYLKYIDNKLARTVSQEMLVKVQAAKKEKEERREREEKLAREKEQKLKEELLIEQDLQERGKKLKKIREEVQNELKKHINISVKGVHAQLVQAQEKAKAKEEKREKIEAQRKVDADLFQRQQERAKLRPLHDVLNEYITPNVAYVKGKYRLQGDAYSIFESLTKFPGKMSEKGKEMFNDFFGTKSPLEFYQELKKSDASENIISKFTAILLKAGYKPKNDIPVIKTSKAEEPRINIPDAPVFNKNWWAQQADKQRNEINDRREHINKKQIEEVRTARQTQFANESIGRTPIVDAAKQLIQAQKQTKVKHAPIRKPLEFWFIINQYSSTPEYDIVQEKYGLTDIGETLKQLHESCSNFDDKDKKFVKEIFGREDPEQFFKDVERSNAPSESKNMIKEVLQRADILKGEEVKNVFGDDNDTGALFEEPKDYYSVPEAQAPYIKPESDVLKGKTLKTLVKVDPEGNLVNNTGETIDTTEPDEPKKDHAEDSKDESKKETPKEEQKTTKEKTSTKKGGDNQDKQNVTEDGFSKAELQQAIEASLISSTPETPTHLTENVKVSVKDVSSATTSAMVDFSDINTTVLSERMDAFTTSETASAGHNIDGVSSGSGRASGASSGDMFINPINVWVKGFFGQSKQKATMDASGFKTKHSGGIIGIDSKINDYNLIGLAFSHAELNANYTNKINTKSKMRADILTGYWSCFFADNTFLNSQVKFGRAKIKNSGESIMKAKGTLFGIREEVGYEFHLDNNINIVPTVGIAYDEIRLGKYRDKNNSLDIDVGSSKNRKLNALGGISVSMPVEMDGFTVVPTVHAAIEHAIQRKGKAVKVTAVNDSADSALISQKKIPKDTYIVGAAIKVISVNNLEVGLNYDMIMRKKYRSHNGALKLRVSF